MLQDSHKIADDIEGYLQAHEEKSMLRFITCGSVDDGKSTLIGRLLYDSKLIFEDQLEALEADSKKLGTQGENIDFALLVDGLAAEREQGITIDVAYRFFATDKRKFIVADTPGHEQYTRNMATGASTADVAVILIDSRQGILPQTRRHSFIASLLGIRHVVLAVNKMDLKSYSEDVFNQIVEDYLSFAKVLDFQTITPVPVSALKGDNITSRSKAMPWFKGPTLLGHLEQVNVADEALARAFRFPVQWVNRPNLDFRGFAGTVTGGIVAVGDAVKILPSAKESKISQIVTFDGDLDKAVAGQAVTLCIEDEIDISRGDYIVSKDHPAEVSDQFEARIVWMSEESLYPGRRYLFKTANKTVEGVFTALKNRVNVNTLEEMAAKKLDLNEIGVCTISLTERIAFDPFETGRETGAFIVIDRMSNNTIGAGMINFALRRASNIHWQAMDVNKVTRSEMKAQTPVALWFTGLSGSGKSTIANIIEKRLVALGHHTYTLDGDNVRHGLNKDLGFTQTDRVENIRRVGEVARLMVDAGLIVLTSFISPFRAERKMVRAMMEDKEFVEVFIDTPLDVCVDRDPKGLYKKVKAGEIKNFTGYDSPYETPETPEVRLDTTKQSPEQCADKLIDFLEKGGYLSLKS